MFSNQGKLPAWVYYAALIFVTVFWGVSTVVYHYFYRFYSASVLTAIMTFFSAAFFWILARKKLAGLTKKFLKVAVPICLLNAFSNMLQRIGLQYTTPANYAFFGHLSCISVPVMMFVFIRKKPTVIQSIAGVCCLAGCFILCGVRFTPDSSLINIGDVLCILSGFLIGVCVAAIGVYTKELDVILFMVIYMTAYFLVSLLMAVGLHFIRIDGAAVEQAVITWQLPLLVAVAVVGLVDIALCWLLRTEVTRHIDPVTVVTVSPCSAAITGVVSVCVGIDRLTPNLLIGGGLIFLSAVAPELIDRLVTRRKATQKGG